MRASILFLCLITIFSSAAFGQRGEKPLNDGKKKQLADALMESGSYYNANDLYQELYEKKQTPALAWSVAEAYYKSRDYPNSLVWYKKVWDASPGAYPEAQFYYALNLKLNGKYDESKKEFDSFRKSTSMRGAESSLLKRKAKNESKGCDMAKLIMTEPLDMEIGAMGSRINAPYTEFSPLPISKDEFIYASLRSDSIIKVGANKKVEMRSQFYTSTREGGVWTEGKPFEQVTDVSGHVGNGTYSLDGNRFYYTVCNPDETFQMICDIYVSENKNDTWTRGRKVPGLSDGSSTVTHPAIAESKNKEVLYFSSNRVGGRGGMDIWYSVITGKGKSYATPRHAGPKINTDGDEVTPFWNKKEQLLYFSSNGHLNIGGLDVFKIQGQERSWKTPLNAGYPVNSNVDDFFYATTEDGGSGFLVSNRTGAIALKNAFCCDDIFEFEYIFPPEFTIMGMVYEKGAATKKAIDGAFIRLGNSVTSKMDSTISETSDKYDFYVGILQDKFQLSAQKAGFTGDLATVSTKGLTITDTLFVDLYLEPIDTTKSITIKDIYYELAKAELRPESRVGLDSLYNILMAYPTTKVEVSSHTDSRGSFDYNNDLSQRRAESVIRYLVDQKGINIERLVPVGYGENNLLNSCADGATCSEEEHQINRRTEFRILGQMPGTIVTYDKATIDAMKALERESGSLDARIKELMESADQDAVEQNLGTDRQTTEVVDNTINEVEELVEEVKEVVEEKPKLVIPATPTAVELSTGLERSGSLYTGQAMVNNAAQVTYTYDSRRPVVYVNGDLFVQLRDAGTISDYKNTKKITLPDGTKSDGDIFTLTSLQIGDKLVTGVEAKINARMKQPIMFGKPFLDKNKCKIDTKKMIMKCK